MRLIKTAAIVLFIVIAPLPCPAASTAGERAKLYFKDAFIPHLWDGTVKTFSDPGVWIGLGVGGALAAVAHQYDWQVDDYWEDHKLDYHLADLGNGWGDTYPTVIIALGLMGAGYAMEDEKLAGAGEALGEAAIISGAIITIIKPLAGKERPDGSDNLAFPSGHSGVTFCTAAVLHHRFGWGIGVPAYAMAVLTGLSRMDVEVHWVSDVVFGATIGMTVGYAVSMYRDDHPYEVRWNKPKPILAPIVGSDRYGMMVAVSF